MKRSIIIQGTEGRWRLTVPGLYPELGNRHGKFHHRLNRERSRHNWGKSVTRAPTNDKACIDRVDRLCHSRSAPSSVVQNDSSLRATREERNVFQRKDLVDSYNSRRKRVRFRD